MKLRPYQEQSIEKLRASIQGGHKTPILCLPTGAGKTVTFSHLAHKAIEKGSFIHVVCHRAELIEQAEKTLKAYGVDLKHVAFNMVQTLTRSPHKIPQADLTIIDECHIGNFRKFCDIVQDHTQIIGVTATPLSASKRNPLNLTFDDVIAPVQISDLIDEGFLAKPVYHLANVNTDSLVLNSTGDFSNASQDAAYSQLFNLDTLTRALDECKGKTIIFCASIEMAERVAELCDGILVHSKMSKREREARVKYYMKEDAATIVNCGILTAGFDDPSIRNVIVYRATTSLTLWLQMCGRGSRPDTEDFHIYDLGNNVRRLGSWDLKRDWKQLFKAQGQKDKEGAIPMKNCISCEALIYASQMECNVCGEAQPRKTKQEAEAQEFEVIEYGQNVPLHLQKDYKEMGVKELIERAQYGSAKTGRPFKIGWIVNQLKNRPNFTDSIKELARIKGYSKGWVWRQVTTNAK